MGMDEVVRLYSTKALLGGQCSSAEAEHEERVSNIHPSDTPSGHCFVHFSELFPDALFTLHGTALCRFLLSLSRALSIHLIRTTLQEPGNDIWPYDVLAEALLLQQFQASQHGAWVREIFAVLRCAPVGVQVGQVGGEARSI